MKELHETTGTNLSAIALKVYGVAHREDQGLVDSLNYIDVLS